MGFLDFLFSNKSQNLKRYIAKGALILDVRTTNEFNTGAIKEAIHIPLQELPERILELTTLKKPLIVCCQSGVRSAKATKLLTQHNIDAINGGGWKKLNALLQL